MLSTKVGFFYPEAICELENNVVNELKGRLWDSEAQFSKGKDTSAFRQYLDARDRVKLFYQEQHGPLK